jgi:hypothetical protein
MNATLNQPPETFFAKLTNAARFWEPWRVLYNLVLTAVVLVWLVATWPHFEPALKLQSLLLMLVLATIANACYCAAYLADLALQFSPLRTLWLQRRWILWITGTLLAALLACYWIADEIYPGV